MNKLVINYNGTNVLERIKLIQKFLLDNSNEQFFFFQTYSRNYQVKVINKGLTSFTYKSLDLGEDLDKTIEVEKVNYEDIYMIEVLDSKYSEKLSYNACMLKKYRPYKNAEEFFEVFKGTKRISHAPKLKNVPDCDHHFAVLDYNNTGVKLPFLYEGDFRTVTYLELLRDFVFEDKTACGILLE